MRALKMETAPTSTADTIAAATPSAEYAQAPTACSTRSTVASMTIPLSQESLISQFRAGERRGLCAPERGARGGPGHSPCCLALSPIEEEFAGAFARTAAACADAHIASPVFSASWVHIVKGLINMRRGFSDSMAIPPRWGSGLGSKGYARGLRVPRVRGRTDPGVRLRETAK